MNAAMAVWTQRNHRRWIVRSVVSPLENVVSFQEGPTVPVVERGRRFTAFADTVRPEPDHDLYGLGRRVPALIRRDIVVLNSPPGGFPLRNALVSCCRADQLKALPTLSDGPHEVRRAVTVRSRETSALLFTAA